MRKEYGLQTNGEPQCADAQERPSLANLLERVKAATGPDRELDALIHLVAAENRTIWWEGNSLYSRHRSEPADHKWFEGSIDPGVVARNWTSADYRHPTYTASLDAALALVERALPGWRVEHIGQDAHPDEDDEWVAEVSDRPHGSVLYDRGCSKNGKTPALALLAALLSALIAQERPSGGVT